MSMRITTTPCILWWEKQQLYKSANYNNTKCQYLCAVLRTEMYRNAHIFPTVTIIETEIYDNDQLKPKLKLKLTDFEFSSQHYKDNMWSGFQLVGSPPSVIAKFLAP